MKNPNKIFLAVLAVIAIFFLYQMFMQDKRSIPVEFRISENPEMDFSSENLSFGGIQQWQSATRAIEIKNLDDEKVKVSLQISKEILPYIIASENNFYLSPGEKKNITFTLLAKNLSLGEYNGKLTITSTKLIFK